MNEHDRRESGHLMLITPDRVFYAGLLGRPRQRCPGAFHVYVAIKGGLRLITGDGFESQGELIVLPPNVPHARLTWRIEALEATTDLDFFSPPRADWELMGNTGMRGICGDAAPEFCELT